VTVTLLDCKCDSYAAGLQVGKLGKWIASGTVGQVDCKWDSLAGGLQLGELSRWTASNVVNHTALFNNSINY